MRNMNLFGNLKPNKKQSPIPAGGIYYRKVTSKKLGQYESKYEPSTEYFPAKVQAGDVFVYKGYEYRYNEYYTPEFYDDWALNEEQGGWGVRVLDDTRTEYDEILEAVNREPIVCLRSTFDGCRNLTRAPEIPSSVRDVEYTFHNCPALAVAPKLPDNIKGWGTFLGCTKLMQGLDKPIEI